ncbi:PH domain-containing protein [Aurantiacibacter sp. MUD11]|uniref:PH domain-containing protein n=1 Tax=Aurantiacibacter sp. MUD11 TaxID=3003265 RepID=UPI0022AAB190|nr:PH domain-containing protein [Aurantiacibacter sp. MUD11]WAT17273.1 PH domain-containing protein [Aurantiacibacter sp. MUD11]
MSEIVEDTAAPEEVPDIEIDEWQRVNPLSMAVQLVRLGFQAIIPAAFVLWGSASDADKFDMAGPIIGLVVLLIIAVVGFRTWLGWVRLRYRVGENDVRVEQGILSRQARSVPYERIQDVSLEQKIVPRLLGLVEVRFETGAGGKDELKLAYVSEAEGEKLRERVRALVEGEEAKPLAAAATDQPPAEVPAASGGRQLFAMDPKRLVTFGLFNFSLVIFAVLLGALQQFEFLLPFDLWGYVESFFETEGLSEAGSYVSTLDTWARVAAILYAVFAVVLVGIASGVVKTLVQDWDFLLERTPKGFRRRRGLLTKTDVVMPVHRVQALVVKTGIIRRRFGWHGLSFVSLAQDSGSANHDVAPFAKMEEIAPIAAEAGFTLPDESEDWRRPSPNYYFDRGVLAGLFVTLIGIVAFTAAASGAGGFVPGLAVIAVAVPALVALLGAREIYRWRYDRHALDPQQVISRKGWLAPRTQVASRVKLHSVEITQGPLGRWRGYCNLVFGMAGGRFAFRGLSLADARKLRAAVLDSIAEVDFAKLPR